MIASTSLSIVSSDLESARRFYGDVLGCALDEVSEEALIARLPGLELNIEGGGLPRKRSRRWMEEAGVYVTLHVDDFDAFVSGIAERGGELLGEPAEGPDGERYAGIADPDGLLIEIAGR